MVIVIFSFVPHLILAIDFGILTMIGGATLFSARTFKIKEDEGFR